MHAKTVIIFHVDLTDHEVVDDDKPDMLLSRFRPPLPKFTSTWRISKILNGLDISTLTPGQTLVGDQNGEICW